jgi:hypothetical protein
MQLLVKLAVCQFVNVSGQLVDGLVFGAVLYFELMDLLLQPTDPL